VLLPNCWAERMRKNISTLMRMICNAALSL
jgi:hypothetical protein